MNGSVGIPPLTPPVGGMLSSSRHDGGSESYGAIGPRCNSPHGLQEPRFTRKMQARKGEV